MLLRSSQINYLTSIKIVIVYLIYFIILVQSLRQVQLFLTPWIAAPQASLSFTITQSLIKFMYMTLSNHRILCRPIFLLHSTFPASGSLPMSQLFTSGGQSIRASALGSVLLMNSQGWFPLGLTGLISLASKGLTRVLSRTTVQKHQFLGAQPLWSNSHIRTWLLEKS